MTMISKTAVGIAVGIAGIFVGYCFYFDQKRRSDPDFKQKLRKRRQMKKQAQDSHIKVIELKDHEVIQRFFLQEVQLGEEMLSCGNVKDGIEHLANAVAVCGQPTQLLQILQKTLPPNIYQALVTQLPVANQKLAPQIGMTEEDVE